MPGVPFTRSEGESFGLSADVQRGARFVSPTYGVRVLADGELDLLTRCRALVCAAPDVVFSHATAAELLRLPAPRRPELEVSTVGEKRPPRRAGVVGHQGLLPDDVVLRSGLAVVRAETTWADLGSRLDLAELVVLGDAVLGRGASRASLAQAAATPARRRGVRLLRRALPLLDGRSESPMESRLRLLLVTSGLPAPQVNRDVVVDGAWLARPDLSYQEARLAIEYEGDHHRTDRRQWLGDKARRRLLEDHGWQVIEVTSRDVLQHPDRLAERVRAALVRRSGAVT
ncbi:hypothetical protein GCM10027446_02260 [Angustibacter peucedani]